MESGVATLQDVAKLAAVSVSTVSRILKAKEGDPIPFSEKTQAQVRRAARRLGYRPSKLARGLVGSRTGIVGLIVPSLEDSFFPSITSALQKELNASGYNVLLVNTEQEYGVERSSLDDFLSWRVDGLIVAPSQSVPDAQPYWELWRLKVPFVLVDRFFADTPFASVTTDDHAGAVLAVEHLLSLGRKCVARAGSALPVSTGRLRHQGYADALLGHGLRPDPALALEAEPAVGAGREVVTRLLELRPRPDALFCFSDMVAVGVIEECLARGVRVPEDLAVVGYADLDFSSLTKVPLTTVRQPRKEIGSLAARRLLEQIRGGPLDTPMSVLPVELIVRESTVGHSTAGAGAAPITTATATAARCGVGLLSGSTGRKQ